MKKSMRKLIATILCMAMVMCNTVTYFAGNDLSGGDSNASEAVTTTTHEGTTNADDNLYGEATSM